MRNPVINTGYFSRNVTEHLKGYLAIAVLLHHIFQKTDLISHTSLLGFFCQSVGYYCVSMFLFISGYGLMYSYNKNRGGYINKYQVNRVLPIFVVNAILVLIYSVQKSILGFSITISDIIFSLIYGGNIVNNGWYLLCIMLFYELFYIAAKFFPRHIPFAATVLVFVYMVLARKMPTWYIVSSLSFPSGLLYCNYKQTIDQWLKLHFYSTFTLVLLAYIGCFTIIYLLQGHNHVLPYSSGIKLAFSFVHGVLFCGIMVLLLATTCMSTQLNKDTTANKFLSQNYLELYVMQGLAFNLLQNPYWHVINDWMYLICSISITFFLAILIHPIFQIVNKSIKKL